jgi:hypothetical protein
MNRPRNVFYSTNLELKYHCIKYIETILSDRPEMLVSDQAHPKRAQTEWTIRATVPGLPR